MATTLRENRPVRGPTAMAQRPDGSFVDFEHGASAAGIDVELTTDAGEASIVVLDRGVGLDGVDPDVLFHPFYRSPAAERMASGLGLGLPVCQRIVTALGGRIWARPRPGGGSEFGFALPLASESLLPD